MKRVFLLPGFAIALGWSPRLGAQADPNETLYVITHIIKTSDSAWTPEEIADTFRRGNELWARYGRIQFIAWPQRILTPGDPEIDDERPRPLWAEFVPRGVVFLDQLGIVTQRGIQESIITDPKLRHIIFAHECGHFFGLSHTNGDDPYGRRTIMQSPLPVGELRPDYDPTPLEYIAPEQVQRARSTLLGADWVVWYRASQLPEQYRNLTPGFVPTGVNAPPTVQITYPTEGQTVSGNVTIAANASDDGGAPTVRFFVDNTLLGEDSTAPYEMPWNTADTNNGSHTIAVEAVDSAGQTARATVTVTVNNADAPPAVRITSPANGSTVSGAVQLSADATDDRPGVSVQFLVNGSVLANDASAPFQATWDTSSLPNGSYTIAAVARDSAGQTAQDQIAVTVDNGSPDSPPTVELTAPASGATISGTVTISARATDDRPGVNVSFFVGAGLVGQDASEPFSVTWDSTTVANGSYTIRAEARDSAGQTASSQITVTVDNPVSDEPPTVRINSPTDGATVNGTITVSATASDDRPGVAVSFFVDGSLLSTDSSAPFTAAWDTTSAGNNTRHTIRAEARDSAGQTASDQVTVTVNQGGVPPGTPPSLRLLSQTRLGSRATGVGRNGDLAIVAANPNVYLVDVSNPTAPRITATISDPDCIACQDAHGQGRYIYLSFEQSRNNTAMAIYDVSNPSAPVRVGVYQDPNLPTAHTLYVSGSRAYLNNYHLLSAGGGRMGIIDISDPTNPRRLGTFPPSGSNAVHDSTVIGNRAYVAAWNFGWYILDVTDPAAIRQIGRTADSARASHNVWPSSDGRFMFTTQEFVDAEVRSWDISDPLNIRQVGRFRAGAGLMPHNVEVEGNYAYIAYYQAGIVVADVSDPANMREVRRYDTHPADAPSGDSDYQGAWDVHPFGNTILVTDTDGGLFVFEKYGTVTPPPDQPPAVRITNPPPDSTVRGTVLIVADATDDRGPPSVRFSVGNSTLATVTAPPYQIEWNTANVSNGTYTISATATDSAGQVSQAQVSVTVANAVDARPTVRITSPVDGATVQGVVTLAADATDDNPGLSVTFSVGGSAVAILSAPPFSTTWDSTAFPDGTYTVRAVATDSSGQSAAAQISITVRNAPAPVDQPPTVRLTAPSAGATLRGTVTVSAEATDDNPGVSVTFSVNGNVIGTASSAPYSISWDTTGTANGTYTLAAEARDRAGQTARDRISITVDNPATDSPPTVRVTAPAAGSTVSGWVTISADADDDQGVAGVDFYVDGNFLGGDTSRPYSVQWNTSSASNASHTIRAEARDTAGQTASDRVTVTVNNAPAPVTTATIEARDAGHSWQGDNRFYFPREEFRSGSDGQGRLLTGMILFSLQGAVPPGATVTRVELEMTGSSGNWALPQNVTWSCDLLGDETASRWNTLTHDAIQAAAAIGRFTPTLSRSDVDRNVTNRLALDTSFPAGNSIAVRVNGPVTNRFSYFSWWGPSTATAASRPRIRISYRDSAPSVAITQPSDGSSVFLGAMVPVAARQVQIAVEASDDVGIAYVDLFAGNAKIARLTSAPYQCTWDTSRLPTSKVTLKAVACDTSGQKAAHAIQVLVDREAPRMAVQTPPDGSPVSGNVTVRVRARDNGRLDRVDIAIDDRPIESTPAGMFDGEIDTTQLANGVHVLRITAWDSVGNKTETSCRLRVYNATEEDRERWRQAAARGGLGSGCRKNGGGGGVLIRIRIVAR